jgi:hypothetical protein
VNHALISFPVSIIWWPPYLFLRMPIWIPNLFSAFCLWCTVGKETSRQQPRSGGKPFWRRFINFT